MLGPYWLLRAARGLAGTLRALPARRAVDSDGPVAAGAVPRAGRVSCAARGDADGGQAFSPSSAAAFVALGDVRAE